MAMQRAGHNLPAHAGHAYDVEATVKSQATWVGEL